MKHLPLVVAVLLVLPVFFSCGGKHDPDNPSTPTTPTTPTDPGGTTTPTDPEDPPTPPAPAIESRNTFRFDKNIVSTTGSGDFVAVFDASLVTKSGDSGKNVVTGSYSFDNDSKTWTYNGFGKIVLGDDNNITFSTDDGVSKTFVAKVSEISSDEESVAFKLNGSWKTAQTVVEFRGGTYRYQGDLNLNEVEKQARDLGYEFTTHLDEGMTVSKIIVTDSMMAAEFKNSQSYAAEHNLRIGSSFDFSEFTKGMTGTGTVEFNDNTCIITVKTVVDESPATLYMTLEKTQ